MDFHVDLEVLFFTEAFTAAWIWTYMWMNPIVLTYVIIKAVLSCETFVTSLPRTNKELCLLFALFKGENFLMASMIIYLTMFPIIFLGQTLFSRQD